MLSRKPYYMFRIIIDFFKFFYIVFNKIRAIMKKPKTIVYMYMLSAFLLIIISTSKAIQNETIKPILLIIFAIILFLMTVWSHLESGYYDEDYHIYTEKNIKKSEEEQINKN